MTVLFDGKTKPAEVPVQNVKKEDREGDLPAYWVVAYIGNNQKCASPGNNRPDSPCGLCSRITMLSSLEEPAPAAMNIPLRSPS